jgi:hypothetical protein
MPARIAGNIPFEIHKRTVAGFTRSSSAISATVSHGSSSTSRASTSSGPESGTTPDVLKFPYRN